MEGEPAQEPIPDDAYVVRGGYMGTRSLQVSAARHFDDPRTPDEFAWSFWCGPGKTADQIARAARFDNEVIRVSTVGRIRAAGFEIERDRDDDDHAKITLVGAPTDGDCKRLRDAFDRPRPRPK